MTPTDHLGGPPNADLVRTLLAHPEGTRLDFKRHPYPAGDAGRWEFVKDLVAMANALPAGSAVAHILLGVDEREADRTGEPVGIEAGALLDDADLHQQVSSLLNRTPQFSVSIVPFEDVRVGVIQIRGGGRPFFPVRTKGVEKGVRRYEALVRDGSSTDVASPDLIQRWLREDDPVAGQLQALELEQRTQELSPTVFIESTSRTRGPPGAMVTLHLQNVSKVPVQVCEVRISIAVRDRSVRTPKADLTSGRTSEFTVDEVLPQLAPGERKGLEFLVPSPFVRSEADLRGWPIGANIDWFHFVGLVEVRSSAPSGRTAMSAAVVSLT